MAQRKKRRASWGKRAFFYVFFPLVVWGAAFLIWLYWHDLKKLVAKDSLSGDRPKATGRIDRDDGGKGPERNRSQEKIQEEERNKLQDIIKQRS